MLQKKGIFVGVVPISIVKKYGQLATLLPNKCIFEVLLPVWSEIHKELKLAR
jgi:hypothetical protein